MAMEVAAGQRTGVDLGELGGEGTKGIGIIWSASCDLHLPCLSSPLSGVKIYRNAGQMSISTLVLCTLPKGLLPVPC